MSQPYCLLIVPLRLASTRVPNKILADVAGTPLCVRVLDRLTQALRKRADCRILVAVDDIKTETLLRNTYGSRVDVVMTDPALPSGTDRVFAAYLKFRKSNQELGDPRGIINVQGDMPYLQGESIVPIVDYYLHSDRQTLAATSILTLSQNWPGDCEFSDIGHVKVICDQNRHAIYFSRFEIPYSRIALNEARPTAEYALDPPELHLGVYGFTPIALAEFCAQSPVGLEKFEGLEQLRALWLGKKILVLKCEVDAQSSFRGVDTSGDLSWARSFLEPKAAKKTPAIRKKTILKTSVAAKKSSQTKATTKTTKGRAKK